MDLKTALEQRFGAAQVKSISTANEGGKPLLLVQPQHKQQVRIVTNGLSDYTMPVDEANKGKEHVELYFCLPSYWDLDAVENPKMNWVILWLNTLSQFVQEKKTWFAHGHTIPAGKPPKSLSETMLQDYFLFAEPILLKNELAPLSVGEKTVHFLSIIPIFEREWKMKTTKSTFYFLRKFNEKNHSELLDDFRSTIAKKGWRKFLP